MSSEICPFAKISLIKANVLVYSENYSLDITCKVHDEVCKEPTSKALMLNCLFVCKLSKWDPADLPVFTQHYF